jgi:hypothetical protein
MNCRAARVAAAYSSSEEDDNRVVKSKKDSRFDELRAIVQRMRNHEKIDDWASVAKDFDDITKVWPPYANIGQPLIMAPRSDMSPVSIGSKR